jgi:hypothetical protein
MGFLSGLFSSPDVPSISSTYKQMLNAQTKYAPQILDLNQQYGPQYTALSLKNLATYLNGANGTPGFLDQYQNSIMPALTSAQNAANSATRTAGVNDAQRLTPSLIALARSANPQAAGLLDTVTSNTSRDLGYGTELTPAERVQLRQSVRGGQAARGLGFGPGDVFDESMAETGAGQNLYQQRMGSAQTVAQMLQSFYTNPLTLLGIASGNGMNAGQVTGTASSNASPAYMEAFNPINPMSLQHQQQQFDSNTAAANNSNGLLGMILGGAPGLASSGLSGLSGMLTKIGTLA